MIDRLFVLVFVSLSVLGCVLVGCILGLVSTAFYLVVLFPLALALGVALSVWIPFHIGDIRNPIAIYFGTVLGVCIAYSCMHYTTYRIFVSTFDPDQFARDARDPADLQLVKQMKEHRFGFDDYLARHALEGITIGGPYPFRIEGAWVYVYWSMELALAIAAAAIGIGFCYGEQATCVSSR
jgi:hypothetical protein